MVFTLCLMIVPFIPVQSDRIFLLYCLGLRFLIIKTILANYAVNTTNILNSPDTASDWMNDFTRICQQQNSLPDWHDTLWNLDHRHSGNDSISSEILLPSVQNKTIFIASTES